MQKLGFLFGTALAVVACTAHGADAPSTTPPPTGKPSIGSFGFDMSGRDTTVAPGDNFFDYADGTYNKKLVIPPDQTRYGAFIMLRDLSETRTRSILEEASTHASEQPTDTAEKTGAFYKAFMDQAMVEKLGAGPLQPDLDLIRAAKTTVDFARLNGLATKNFLGSLIDVGIQPDAKDPTKYAIILGQSGLGMPDRDYYLTRLSPRSAPPTRPSRHRC